MDNSRPVPLVLAIGGHDPSGGAGLQADIEAVAANGCHALSIVTALTTQNTCGVVRIHLQPTAQIETQCRLILEESPVSAIKLGLLGSAQVAHMLADLLDEVPQLPVILDPVLTAGSDDTTFANDALRAAIRDHLSPRCTLMTPNSPEARTLGRHGDLSCCAEAIIAGGSAAVLITGAHEVSQMVVNRLYTLAGLIQEYQWPRLADSYHGSGCTMASAIAAKLAMGESLVTAVAQAQIYTWESLNQAFRSGRCQLTPNRFYAQRN